MLLLRSEPGMATGMESPGRRAEGPEGLRGRLYENLDIVDAALPSVSCLPMIPAPHRKLVC